MRRVILLALLGVDLRSAALALWSAAPQVVF